MTHVICSFPVLNRILPLIALRMVGFPITAFLVAWAAPGTMLESIFPSGTMDTFAEFAAHVS